MVSSFWKEEFGTGTINGRAWFSGRDLCWHMKAAEKRRFCSGTTEGFSCRKFRACRAVALPCLLARNAWMTPAKWRWGGLDTVRIIDGILTQICNHNSQIRDAKEPEFDAQ